MIKQILTWLSGKKTAIFAILTLTISFIVLKGIIDGDEAAYISGVIAIIFGSASVATPSVVYGEKFITN